MCKDLLSSLQQQATLHQQRIMACGGTVKEALNDYRKTIRQELHTLAHKKVGGMGHCFDSVLTRPEDPVM